MSEYKKVENAKVELTSTIEGETWKDAQAKAFDKLAKQLELKGFRKGKVPTAMARKAINEGSILLEAADNLAQKTLETALDEHKVELIDRPTLKVDDINSEHLVVTFICPVKPDVEIESYKGLGYHEEEAEVTDEEIDAQINLFKESKAELELTDGLAEKDNIVVIDYEGFIDGIPFEGGKAENHSLELGSNSFIPGFEDQLIGSKPEEEKEIKVTFPEDYHAENLKGKEAVFKVTVHEIKKKVLPELDSDIIDELGLEDVHTEQDLRHYLKDVLTKQKQHENETKARNELYDKLNENAKIDVPEVMVDDELNGMINDYERQFAYQQAGINLNDKMREMLKSSMHDEALKRVRISLILEEIAKKENIETSAEEVEEEYKKLADQYHMELQDIKRSLPISFIQSDLRDKKTFEFLKNN